MKYYRVKDIAEMVNYSESVIRPMLCRSEMQIYVKQLPNKHGRKTLCMNKEGIPALRYWLSKREKK